MTRSVYPQRYYCVPLLARMLGNENSERQISEYEWCVLSQRRRIKGNLGRGIDGEDFDSISVCHLVIQLTDNQPRTPPSTCLKTPQ